MTTNNIDEAAIAWAIEHIESRLNSEPDRKAYAILKSALKARQQREPDEWKEWTQVAQKLLRELLPDRKLGCICANCLRDELAGFQSCSAPAPPQSESEKPRYIVVPFVSFGTNTFQVRESDTVVGVFFDEQRAREYAEAMNEGGLVGKQEKLINKQGQRLLEMAAERDALAEQLEAANEFLKACEVQMGSASYAIIVDMVDKRLRSKLSHEKEGEK